MLNFRSPFLKLFEQVVSPCWPHLQVATAALVELVEKLQVDEVFFQVALLEVFFVQVLLVFKLVLPALQLLVGCRVGVAVRASPLQ